MLDELSGLQVNARSANCKTSGPPPQIRYYFTSMPYRVYLDWNATTPLRDEARRAISDALDLPGNASSVHAEGREARKSIEGARGAIAAAVGGLAKNVVFTSGGTEATSGTAKQARSKQREMRSARRCFPNDAITRTAKNGRTSC